MPTSPLNRDPVVARVSGAAFLSSYSSESWTGLEISPQNTGQGLRDCNPDGSQLWILKLSLATSSCTSLGAVPFQDRTWAGVTMDRKRCDFTEAN